MFLRYVHIYLNSVFRLHLRFTFEANIKILFENHSMKNGITCRISHFTKHPFTILILLQGNFSTILVAQRTLPEIEHLLATHQSYAGYLCRLVERLNNLKYPPRPLLLHFLCSKGTKLRDQSTTGQKVTDFQIYQSVLHFPAICFEKNNAYVLFFQCIKNYLKKKAYSV